ncbi:unnamed protein product [Rangifer tarandus platyrhynchus]|uniref:Uncharacterized protein n=1 Tax=Rangifer tarandus platyrhynchus TaxID=3082113 RepID=A0ABN8Y573_RANTA|nr:unnamed protein product [Rangifer tarandus platyrhynchus]
MTKKAACHSTGLPARSPCSAVRSPRTATQEQPAPDCRQPARSDKTQSGRMDRSTFLNTRSLKPLDQENQRSSTYVHSTPEEPAEQAEGQENEGPPSTPQTLPGSINKVSLSECGNLALSSQRGQYRGSDARKLLQEKIAKKGLMEDISLGLHLKNSHHRDRQEEGLVPSETAGKEESQSNARSRSSGSQSPPRRAWPDTEIVSGLFPRAPSQFLRLPPGPRAQEEALLLSRFPQPLKEESPSAQVSEPRATYLSVAAAPPPEGAVRGRCRKFVPLPAPDAAGKGQGAPRRVRDCPLRSRAGRSSQISAGLPPARLQVYSGSPGKDEAGEGPSAAPRRALWLVWLKLEVSRNQSGLGRTMACKGGCGVFPTRNILLAPH